MADQGNGSSSVAQIRALHAEDTHTPVARHVREHLHGIWGRGGLMGNWSHFGGLSE